MFESRRHALAVRRRPNASFSTRSGAAVVELAVLLPLLMLLFVLATDFARVIYFSVTLNNCARAGALYAYDPTAASESAFNSAQAAALAEATNLNPQPTITSANGVDASGRAYVEVTATYAFNTITSFPCVPNNIQLSRKVRMFVAAATPTPSGS